MRIVNVIGLARPVIVMDSNDRVVALLVGTVAATATTVSASGVPSHVTTSSTPQVAAIA